MSFYELKVEGQDYLYFNHTIKDTETVPHFHSAIELLFCVGGAQDVRIGGEAYVLEDGCGCFIDSYTVHSLKPSGAELYAIAGDAHFFNRVFTSCDNVTPPRIFKFENLDFISFLYTIYNKNRINKASFGVTSRAIAEPLPAEMSESFRFVKRRKDKQNELVAGVLQYAAEHYRGDLSKNGAFHEYYHPETRDGVFHKGFTGRNTPAANMIAYLEGRETVEEWTGEE